MLINPFNNFINTSNGEAYPFPNRSTWELVFASNNYIQIESSDIKSVWKKSNYPIVIINSNYIEFVPYSTRRYELSKVNEIVDSYNSIALGILKKSSNSEITIDSSVRNISNICNESKVDNCIYVIGNENLPFVKIGKTNNILKRLSTLQTSLPYRLDLIYLLDDKHRTLEKRLHNVYSEYRVRGEWFYNSILDSIGKNYKSLIINK